MTQHQINCFIFYFDIIGVVNNYIQNPKVIDQIVNWQRDVRGEFSFLEENSTCKTLNDNVWARITSRHPESDMHTVLDFAGKTMRLAQKHGFEKYFGVLTYGDHTFDLRDRTLSSGGDPTDITSQHIDTLSGPHIRAAFAEKWSSDLANLKKHPCLNSVWVSQEVLFDDNQSLHDLITYSNTPAEYQTVDLMIDLNDPKYATTKKWVFPESKFQFIKA